MAYGTVPAPSKPYPLDVRLYRIPPQAATAEAAAVITIPFDFTTVADSNNQNDLPDVLEDRLRQVFNAELEAGITYPQRDAMNREAFRGYFLSYDLIVGLLVSQVQAEHFIGQPLQPNHDGLAVQASRTRLLEGHDWDKAYAFSYYIKPNYPGRSSHLCNAGFLVPSSHRGLGLGGVAGRSFLHYGPLAGYRGSVFNLVYANNMASVRIWDRLGFQRVGKIPAAGLLRRADGQGEEYVDAWVIHGDFAILGKQGQSDKPAETTESTRG